MKAIIVDGPRRARQADVPRPELQAGELLVRVRACGVCGTDVHIYRGEYLGSYPVIPGHEFAGEVAAAQLVADAVVNTDAGFDAPELSGGFDAVIDATGSPAIIERTVDLARHGGRILWFGVAARDAATRVRPFDVFRKGLTIHSSYTSVRNSAAALALLQGGRIRVEELVSHRLPLAEFERAMRLMERPEGVMKVQVRPESEA